ncbi:tetratricopeptide repeat protein [Cyanobium sp. FGCU-6]|nr:tetratricopeptide repeat protein [Cyanobium sp. FGCU6]
MPRKQRAGGVLGLSASLDARRVDQATKLLQRGLHEQAEQEFLALVSEGSSHPWAHANLGTLCLLRGDSAAAVGHLQRALDLRPDDPDLLANLAVALRSQGRLEEALALFRQALGHRPEDPGLLTQLGNILQELGDAEEGNACFQQAIAADPYHADAQWGLALGLLRCGQFEEAWQKYEWRWLTRSFRADHLPGTLPEWTPERAVQRLLVWGEQGVGDQILFATMLREVLDLVPAVTLRADPRLQPLLQRSLPALRFSDPLAPLEESAWEAQIAMGSLGRHLRRQLGDFLAHRAPFLQADPQRNKTLREQLAPGGRLVCGISWASRGADLAWRKSIPLAELAAALHGPDVLLVSLQYGPVTDDLQALRKATGIEVVEAEGVDTLNNLDDLAALITACDLVVSISNTTVHLAGALGTPTWALLEDAPSWRWGQRGDGEISHWYASVRLFRQDRSDDWTRPLDQVRGELAALLARRVG